MFADDSVAVEIQCDKCEVRSDLNSSFTLLGSQWTVLTRDRDLGVAAGSYVKPLLSV